MGKQEDELTQIYAVKIGKLETKAIGMLIAEKGITKILEKYLTTKERNVYYRAKYNLRRLLTGESE